VPAIPRWIGCAVAPDAADRVFPPALPPTRHQPPRQRSCSSASQLRPGGRRPWLHPHDQINSDAKGRRTLYGRPGNEPSENRHHL
jgi:hypothetical protein